MVTIKEELADLFEQRFIFDIVHYPFKNDNEMDNLIKCIKKERVPTTDTEIIWYMKYTRNFDKNKLFEIMLRYPRPLPILMLSNICHRDDKDMYRKAFYSQLKNFIDDKGYNYVFAKIIIYDEMNKKIKSKVELKVALDKLSNIDQEFCKNIEYYRYFCNYYIGNYDEALTNLINFLRILKYYNSEYIEICYDKLNIIRLFDEISELPNRDIFNELYNRVCNNKSVKFIQGKMNKFKNIKNMCVNCKNNTLCIDYYNCPHLYCLKCIGEKKCFICKNKYIY